MMSATHLENSVLLGPYLSVSISAYPSHIASVSTPNDGHVLGGQFYTQECGSGPTTILEKRPWDSTPSTFLMCRFYS